MPETETPGVNPASQLAEHFYSLIRTKLFEIGHPKLFVIHEWKEAPGEVRGALTAVFDGLITEARESREQWTRTLIEQEGARIQREIEERQRRGEWHAIEKPPLAELRRLDSDETRVEVIEEIAATEALFGGQYFFTDRRKPLLLALAEWQADEGEKKRMLSLDFAVDDESDFGCLNSHCGV